MAGMLADKAYWTELADKLGWRLLGWTYRKHATFATDEDSYQHVLQITLRQRDDIARAILKAGLR